MTIIILGDTGTNSYSFTSLSPFSTWPILELLDEKGDDPRMKSGEAFSAGSSYSTDMPQLLLEAFHDCP